MINTICFAPFQQATNQQGVICIVIHHQDWFREDFGGTPRGVLEHLRQYAREELAERLKGYDGGLEDGYAWELNEP